MITPSFSITATERVLPKLALDFTTASLDSRVTFTRTTDATAPATYVNSSGYITAATNDQPRFDYDPVTLACKGLLIEESRSNILLQSEDFATTWAVINVTPTQDAAVSPSNVQNADKIAVANGQLLANNYIYQGIVKAASAITYTASIFAKAAEFNRVGILVNDNASLSNRASVTISLVDGSVVTAAAAVGTFTAASGTVTTMKDGWYRITLTFTSSTETNLRYRIYTADSIATTGNGSNGIYIWGAQLEAGAFPTSYIPTTSASLTRNADVATMTGTNFSSWWTATNGASDIWLIPKSTSTLAYMSFDDNTANNKIIVANSTTSGQSTITSSGSLQATLTAGTITANATNKIGCSWNTNNCAATANATTPATTASATIPSITQLRIGSNGSAYANAWIQKLFYWPQRITNNEIQAFTK